MRALFAWLDIPASASGARQALCKTGKLPAGNKEHQLSAATRNLRVAALSTFYEWLIAEYIPDNFPMDFPPSHPLERFERPLSIQQLNQKHDGLLTQDAFHAKQPSKLFRRHQDTPSAQALSPSAYRKGYICQSRSNEWLRTISHLTQHSSRFLPLRRYRTTISLHSSLISLPG